MKVWIYGRENGAYAWGNLGEYDQLDKGLLLKVYGHKNLICVMSDKAILSDNELKKASKWQLRYSN